MTKKELTNKLNTLEDELMREECRDRGYRFDYVRTLKQEIKETEKMLANM